MTQNRNKTFTPPAPTHRRICGTQNVCGRPCRVPQPSIAHNQRWLLCAIEDAPRSKSSKRSKVLCSASLRSPTQGGSVETMMARRWSSAHAERRYCPGGSSSGRGTSSALHARTQPITHQPFHVATAVCCGVCRHCDNDNLQHHLRTSSSTSHAVWRLVQ